MLTEGHGNPRKDASSLIMHRGAWLAESKEKALRKDALEKPPQKQPSQRDDPLEGNNPALNTMTDTKELKLSSSNCTRIRTMQVP